MYEAEANHGHCNPARIQIIEVAGQLAHKSVDAAETEEQIIEAQRVFAETLLAGKPVVEEVTNA